MDAYLDSRRYTVPPSTPERDLRYLNKVAMHTSTLLRTPLFQPTLERWGTQARLLDIFSRGALKEQTRRLVSYIDRMDDPPTPTQLSEFSAVYEPWRAQSWDPLRHAACAFLLEYRIPPIPLLEVVTKSLQEVALSSISGVTFATRETVGMKIFPTFLYALPNGDIISDLPRSRTSLKALLRPYDRALRAPLMKLLQRRLAAGV